MLVITIVIMIILAGAVILTLVNSGIIGQTKIGIFKNNAANYKSELQTYIANQLTTDTSFKVEEFSRDGATIQTYITSMSDADALRYMIVQGELVYIYDTTLFTSDEIAALDDIGIKSFGKPYQANTGSFDLLTDYTGDNIYKNPYYATRPNAEFTFVGDTDTFMVCDDFSIDILNNDTMYEGTFTSYVWKEDITVPAGLTLTSNGKTYLTGEEYSRNYQGWMKVNVSGTEGNLIYTEYSILPSNLPIFKLSDTLPADTNLTDMGKHFSLTPYEM